MSSETSLQLGDITDDLIEVLDVVRELRDTQGSATYETVRQATSGQFHLHLLSYVRFLEGQSLLTYDRISDEMTVTDQADEVWQDPQILDVEAREAFAEQLGTVDVGEDDGDDGLGDVFGDIEDDAQQAVDEFVGDSATQRIDPADVGFEMPAGDAASEVDGGEYAGVSPADSQAQQSNHGASTSGGSGSLPTEENSMNGEINAPEASAQWSGTTGDKAMQETAFERLEEIGSGGIGTVYRGVQKRLNRPVAIKEVREIFNVFAGIKRSDILDRFQSIVETQASLIHPNIIQLIDVDTSGEYPFSVMQLAPNGNLRRLLDQGDRPPLKVSLKYFLQILHALNTAHDQEIVHGSLKPENVVLDDAGNAMITDFCISKIVEHDGGMGNQVYVGVGSVAYMSPEQFQDPNLATISTDIYSAGIMFYEMLTGKVPGRRSPMPSSFYPDIPRALDDIFDRMTMDTEEDRYDSVEEIIAELYGADNIMELLDKRSGVLFLRDPMEHGEVGLSDDVAGDLVGDETGFVADDDWGGGGNDDSASADAEATGEEDMEADVAEELEDDVEASEPASSDEPDLDDGDGGDVLNKLDQYGEMFEEE